ncbi:MAG: hypothetical protein AAB388_04430 [Patescibacteria group bacterium]
MTSDLWSVYATALSKHKEFLNLSLQELIQSLWPKVEELDHDGETKRFRVTMSPLANLLGAIICGDHNAEFHTGTGKLQTLTLVGMCSAITSKFRPGYALARIEPDVSFKAPVPIGASVLMTAHELRAKEPFSVFELNAIIEACGTPLFGAVPRKLTMCRIAK